MEDDRPVHIHRDHTNLIALRAAMRVSDRVLRRVGAVLARGHLSD
jgi:hypothetical protein